MTTPNQQKIMMAGIGVVVLGCLVAAVVNGDSGSGTASPDTTAVIENSVVVIAPVGDETTTTVAVTIDSSVPTSELQDLAGDDPTSTTACSLTVRSLASGDTGESVT